MLHQQPQNGTEENSDEGVGTGHAEVKVDPVYVTQASGRMEF